MIKKASKSSLKKTLLVVSILVVLVGTGVAKHYFVTKHSTVTTTSTPLTTSGTNTINYGPPTAAEKQDSANRKDQIVQQNTTTAPGASKKQVAPVITSPAPNTNQSGQQIRLTGYISGITENGGTCTATFTNGNTSIPETSQSFANASTTDCTPMIVDRSTFPTAGSWSVTLSYTSATAVGVSSPTTFTLQ